MINEFIWTDLSTYTPNESIKFYEQVFNWKFLNDNNYHIGGIDSHQDIGIYETPEFFKKINMPHFWMNYIQVSDLNKTVEVAEQLGGKIELSDVDFYNGTVALIRDPMGSGFTVYEDRRGYGRLSQTKHTVGFRELHSSNVQEVYQFYTDLFKQQNHAVLGSTPRMDERQVPSSRRPTTHRLQPS